MKTRRPTVGLYLLLERGALRTEVAAYLGVELQCADRVVDAWTEMCQVLVHDHFEPGDPTTAGKECPCRRVTSLRGK